jgi:hypothetical protein
MYAHSPQQIPSYTYCLYGIVIKSHWPLPCAQSPEAPAGAVELVEAPAAFFAKAAQEAAGCPNVTDWFHEVRLSDGSIYLRWPGLFEFLVSADGSRLTACPTSDISYEALLTYLLGHVFSFALLKRGFDPLHATAVMVHGGVVGFLGDSGYGKSSLAAAFLQAGYPIVTDDLLVMTEKENGLWVYPGIPRIKLFPEIASVFLGSQVMGTPMNPLTRKLVIPLDRPLAHQDVAPLKALYVLTRPSRRARGGRVAIRRLAPRPGFIALLRNSFNTFVVEPTRLTRQFDLNSRIVSTVPIKMLSYPRILAAVPSLRDAILADLSG